MNNSYKTILTIIVGFLALHFLFQKDWMLYTAAGVGLLSLISELFTTYILKLWFGLAKVLGAINSRILLSVIYFIILFPLALVNRLTGKQVLLLKKGSGKSYYTERNYKYVASDFDKPW